MEYNIAFKMYKKIGKKLLYYSMGGVGLRSTRTENWQEGKWDRGKRGDRITNLLQLVQLLLKTLMGFKP